MSSKEKKLKTSKGEDKKSQKKGEEITILVDNSNTESIASPAKIDHDNSGLESLALHRDESLVEQEDAKKENDQLKDEKNELSDATKLTEILVESYEGEFKRGMYDGPGKCSFFGGNYYDGEFVEGMMHGHGKFIWASGLQYEGEFSHNCVTGKGTYTWPDKSCYEGDVVNGLRHGIGTFTDKSGFLSYTGEWVKGNRHGKGFISYTADGSSYYDGEWVQNVRHGHGTRQYPSGNVYKGMWFNNVRHGDGTMKWVDTNQMYIGQWEDGLQHGLGQHVWYVQRVPGSQYTLRNTYNGELVKGIRHGYGTFYYANGAKYEGYWYNNMKHGKGRFTFKNGRYYEGQFDSDHIKEYPNFGMDGTSTPDITGLRTCTPLPMENMSIHSNASLNTLGPSFQINLQSLIKTPDIVCEEDDSKQVANVIKRHISALKKIYDYYSCLGYYESSDNTFILSHMQFWRMMRDCQLHYKHLTLIDMDRILEYETNEPQNPHDKILFRQFVNHIITLSIHLFHQDFMLDGSVLFSECVNQLITNLLLKNACNVKGQFFYETRRAITALEYIDEAYLVYKSACKSVKQNSLWLSMKMRDFLFLMKDLKLINNDLTAKHVVEILTSDNPNATDEQDGYNLELEMSFLEFFEALVSCAQHYVTEALAKDPTSSSPCGSTGHKSAMLGAQATGDQLTVFSDHTSGRSAPMAADGEEEADGKSSLAPNMTPRSATSAAGGGGLHASASVTDRVQSSVVAGGTASKAKTEASGSLPELRRTESKNISSNPLQQSIADVGSEPVLDLDKDHVDREVQEDGEVGQGFDFAGEIAETRKFNFWTHQLFIFFVIKFFPAYHHYAMLTQLVKEKLENNAFIQVDHAKNCICRGRVSACPTYPKSAMSAGEVPVFPPAVTPVVSLPEES